MTDPAPIDTGWHPLADGRAPEWAVEWGQDRYGVFAVIEVERVRQRMRWIPPGRFVMGSPDDEPGRWDDEGPRTKVRIADGFWLFDTPVTQALWQAVMGDNPSRFQSPDRPVERVAWEDSQRFVERINERIPGVDLSLPSEAYWEYACRAGTDSALYTGPIEILGDNNAPALDPIAWYGGNSGQGFDLENGYDTSDWTEQQYPNDNRAGSHPVAQKRPNAWGLYDMLGNVWEWTEDAWQGSHDGAAPDGRARPGEPGARRVVRGGSWIDDARLLRCAFRNLNEPGGRDGLLGLRCARVQRS